MHDVHEIARACGFVKDETYALACFKQVPQASAYMTYNERVTCRGSDTRNGLADHEVTLDVWCRSRDELERRIGQLDGVLDACAGWLNGGYVRDEADYLLQSDTWTVRYTFEYTQNTSMSWEGE